MPLGIWITHAQFCNNALHLIALFKKQNGNGGRPFTSKWQYCTKKVSLSQMQRLQENISLVLFLGVGKVQHMAKHKLWMELGLIIRNLQEDDLPVALTFMTQLTLWAGTCKSLEGVWESKCQMQKNSIWHITKVMEALKEGRTVKKLGY